VLDVNTLETRHDYIQCLIPGPEIGMNPQAWKLCRETAPMVTRNPMAARQIEKALRLMFKFYGLDETNTGLFQLREAGSCFQNPDRSPHTILTVAAEGKSHNWKRVSRILTFMVLTGQHARARNLLAFLYHSDNTGIFPSKESHWLPSAYNGASDEIKALHQYLTFILYDGKVDGHTMDEMWMLPKGENKPFDRLNFFQIYFPVDVFSKTKGTLSHEMTKELSKNQAYMHKMNEAIRMAMDSLGFSFVPKTVLLQSDTEQIEWGTYNITTFRYDDGIMWARLFRITTFMIWIEMKTEIDQILDIINGLISSKKCNITSEWWDPILTKYQNIFQKAYTGNGQALAHPQTEEEMKQAAAELGLAEEQEMTGQIDFTQIRMALLTP